MKNFLVSCTGEGHTLQTYKYSKEGLSYFCLNSNSHRAKIKPSSINKMLPNENGGFISWTVLLWIILSSVACLHVHAQLSVDEGPQDAAVFQGDNVTFVCDLRNTADYIITWYHLQRNERIIIINRQVIRDFSPDLQSRISVTGDADNEEFTLRIEDVQVADDGHYFCQYAATNTSVYTDVCRVKLVVLIPPDPESPECEVIPAVAMEPVDVGDQVSLRCIASGGAPYPDLALYKGGDLLAGPGRTINHRYDITADDNGVIFTCSMTTPASDEPHNCSLMPLRISPNATILTAVPWVEEGSQVSFECYGEGVPSIANYKWTVTNNDTGEILPPERYTVTQSGSSLEIAVMKNLELLCTVSVPSGLTGNAIARVEALEWGPTNISTTDLTNNPTSSTPDLTNNPTSSTTDLTNNPTSSTTDLITNNPTSSTTDLTTNPTSSTTDLTTNPTSSTTDLTNNPTSSTTDLTNNPTSPTIKPTQTSEMNVPSFCASNPPSPSSSSSAATIVAVVLGIVVIVLILIIILLLWQRKHLIKKSTSPQDGARMTKAAHGDDVAADEGRQDEPQGNQENTYAAVLEDKVNDGQDVAIEMRQSACQDNNEYAYADVHWDKNDTEDTGKYEAVSVGKINKTAGRAPEGPAPDGPMQDASAYEMPSKLAHVYASVNE